MMWKFTITNIAGIRFGEATLNEGTNIVQGSNFRGKTSFIKAIQTVSGTSGWSGQPHPLTEGCEEGTVRLESEKTGSIEARLVKNNGNVTQSGETLLESEVDITCARLFAYLDDENPIRSAVREGDNTRLTKLLQSPLKLENIEEKIETLRLERKRVQREIEDLKASQQRLTSLRQEVTKLENELDRLEETRDHLEAKSDQTEEQASLNEDLSKKQTALQTTEKEINRLTSRLSRLEERRDEVKAELQELEEIEDPESHSSIEELQSQIEEVDLQLQMISDIHRSNQQMLQEENILEQLTEVRHRVGSEGDEIECWVCGQTAFIEDIENNLETIDNLRNELLNRKQSLEMQRKSLNENRRMFERNQRRRSELQEEHQNLGVEIEETQQEINSATLRKEELAETVEEMKEEFESVSEKIDEELTQVKTDIGSVQQQIKYQTDQIEELNNSVQDLEELQQSEKALSERIESLRERREIKQLELIERFDSAITKVINRFAPGFENAYLERKTHQDGSLATFEIRLSRQVDGVSQPSSIDQLSEAERELVGIVTALSGFHTYKVQERVPIILLDGISQLAAENLHGLLDHLEELTDVLVTTAYPEAGDLDGNIITPSEWEVVSHNV